MDEHPYEVFPNGSIIGWPEPPTMRMRIASLQLMFAANRVGRETVSAPATGIKCACHCGRNIRAGRKWATPGCRQRAWRRNSSHQESTT